MNSDRHITVNDDGIVKRLRNPAALRDDIVALLEKEGPLPKKRIIMILGCAQKPVDTALDDLLDDERVEQFRRKSSRGRMDQVWCVAGHAPAVERVNFHAAETLAAFQAAALALAIRSHAGTPC